MKELSALTKRSKAIATRKIKPTQKAKNVTRPKRARQQESMSWQLLIDRERMLI